MIVKGCEGMRYERTEEAFLSGYWKDISSQLELADWARLGGARQAGSSVPYYEVWDELFGGFQAWQFYLAYFCLNVGNEEVGKMIDA